MKNKYLIFITRFFAGLMSILFGFATILPIYGGGHLDVLSLFVWFLSFLYFITFVLSLYHLFTGKHVVLLVLSIILSITLAFIGNL